MKLTTFTTVLALMATAFATAIPNPITSSNLVIRKTPLGVNYTFSPSGLSTLSTQLTGVSGTLQLNFINRNTIESWYSVTDTKGDSHPVYMTTVVYDGGNDELRCDNKLGHDHTQVCDWRSYHRSARISYIVPKWCVNIQHGGDQCVTGPKFQNPHP
jgi:hypothetical protein